MPLLSRLLIRAALLHLLAGFTLGGLLLANKVWLFWPWLWQWLPAHHEHLLLGWTAQFVMGIGFWILPRFRTSRGDERPVWVAFVTLNLGVLLVAYSSGLGGPASLKLIGRGLELIAIPAFMRNAWPRVKPIGV